MDWWDVSYNWLAGCSKVSPACDNCWAPRFINRMGLDRTKFAGVTSPDGGWTGQVLVLHNTLRQLQPLRWARPRWCFVNIMADTFHQDVPLSAIADQLALAAILPQHIWMLCTKRERRMAQVLGGSQTPELVGRHIDRLLGNPAVQRAVQLGRAVLPANNQVCWPLPNLWAGVTLESDNYLFRVTRYLAATPAAVRFASSEPLMDRLAQLDTGLLDWLIVGGEDLPADVSPIRPLHPAWVEDLRDRCARTGTAFWFKQWGSSYPVGRGGRAGSRYTDPAVGGQDLWLAPDGTQHPDSQPGRQLVRRMHKNAAGRLLDNTGILQVPAGWERHPAVTAHVAAHQVVISRPGTGTRP